MGWTDKAVVLSASNGMWMPKRFCTNWTEDKPPKMVDATIPKWLYDKWKGAHNVTDHGPVKSEKE